MRNSSKDYNNTKVEFQVLTDDNNYEGDVSMTSDGYDDGEIVFIDCRVYNNKEKLI